MMEEISLIIPENLKKILKNNIKHRKYEYDKKNIL